MVDVTNGIDDKTYRSSQIIGMSKSAYAGGTRRRSARETYLEQISHGRGLTTYSDKKRKNFTHLRSLDDTDLAYRSMSNYLRQSRPDPFDVEPMEMTLAKNLPRTKSASEMTPRTTRPASGTPMYKAQEDYYDEVQTLKKDLKAMREENSTLRSKNRRLEEDVARRKKEIDSLGDPNKDNDLRRALTGGNTDRTNANQSQLTNVVMSLKQRIFKLQSQLKEKENRIDEMESDPRWTRSTEFEIQNRALAGEAERQKFQLLKFIQNDYSASLDEEKKVAVIKLDAERKELKKENESLKKKLEELENSKGNADVANERIEKLQEKVAKFHHEAEKSREEMFELKEKLREIERDRDEFEKKFEKAKTERDEFERKLVVLSSSIDRRAENLRKNHSARVIQRGWRQHQTNKQPKPSIVDANKLPKDNSDKDSKINVSPGERQIDPKINQRESRPSSANTSEDTALRTVQASLRGLFNRTFLEKRSTSPKTKDQPPHIESDEEISPKKPFEALKPNLSNLRDFARSTGKKSTPKMTIPDLNSDLKRSISEKLNTSHEPIHSPVSSKRSKSPSVPSHDDDDDVV